MNRAMRRALRNDPHVQTMALEGQILGSLGYLDSDGVVVCPECGQRLTRRYERGELVRDGFDALFACECGWFLSQVETPPL